MVCVCVCVYFLGFFVCVLFCFVFSTSLLSGTKSVLGSACIFPSLVLEPAISPRGPGSIHWNVIRRHDVGAECAPRYWGVLPSRPFQLTE